jgi:hypothetical protein
MTASGHFCRTGLAVASIFPSQKGVSAGRPAGCELQAQQSITNSGTVWVMLCNTCVVRVQAPITQSPPHVSACSCRSRALHHKAGHHASTVVYPDKERPLESMHKPIRSKTLLVCNYTSSVMPWGCISVFRVQALASALQAGFTRR